MMDQKFFSSAAMKVFGRQQIPVQHGQHKPVQAQADIALLKQIAQVQKFG